MNHKWDANNKCTNCGIVREMKTWKLLMAMAGNKDYYKYGRAWYYGRPNSNMDYLVKAIGFKRPDCKK